MSEQTKWTPGPWRVSSAHKEVICAGDEAIAELWQRGNVNQENATAHLIATAPELYEALMWARNELAQLPRSMAYDFTHLPKIDAVLAKARGAS